MSHICLIISVLAISGCIMIAYGITPSRGTWSEWSPWSSCSSSCGSGIRLRSRVCLGGAYCPGLRSEIGFCNSRNCPVDGGWSSWHSWGDCSVTCGNGTRGRMRTCTNPRRRFGGARCAGAGSQSHSCNPRPCQADMTAMAQKFAKSLMYVKGTRTTQLCNMRSAPCTSSTVCSRPCLDLTVVPDRDFLFIVDSSGSIKTTEYAQAKNDISWMAVKMCGTIGRDLQIGAMHFSWNATEAFAFNAPKNDHELHLGIRSMGYQGSITKTFLAFEFAKNTMFTGAHGMRTGAIHQALVITDGKSNGAPSGQNAGAMSAAAAQELKRAGVEVFALTIGNFTPASLKEIRTYVSGDDDASIDHHVFSVDSVAQLNELVNNLALVHNICG